MSKIVVDFDRRELHLYIHFIRFGIYILYVTVLSFFLFGENLDAASGILPLY